MSSLSLTAFNLCSSYSVLRDLQFQMDPEPPNWIVCHIAQLSQFAGVRVWWGDWLGIHHLKEKDSYLFFKLE